MRYLLITLITHTRSQDALATYEPIWTAGQRRAVEFGLPRPFADFADFVERSSALIGSPAQIVDKVQRYHARFGHTVLHLHADGGGLTPAQHRDSLALWGTDIAPVLDRSIPDPPWPAPVTELTGASR